MPKGVFERKRKEVMERIESNSIPIPFSGCLVWLGATINDYGVISRDHRPRNNGLVHRIAYEKAFGPVPDTDDVHHRCGVKCCWNVEHLERLPKDVHGLLFSVNAKKTHCPNGHEYNRENTYYAKQSNGKEGTGRVCRICMVAHARRYRARKK